MTEEEEGHSWVASVPNPSFKSKISCNVLFRRLSGYERAVQIGAPGRHMAPDGCGDGGGTVRDGRLRAGAAHRGRYHGGGARDQQRRLAYENGCPLAATWGKGRGRTQRGGRWKWIKGRT